jgi:hypothetical protein
MIPGTTGAHLLLYSKDSEADRAFFRDVLGFPAVDAGGGWLIFGLPPAEVGIHPSEGEKRQLHGGRQLLTSVLYLMCDNLQTLIKSLEGKNVSCSPVEEERLGYQNDDSVAQRRRDWPLSTHTPDGFGPVTNTSN